MNITHSSTLRLGALLGLLAVTGAAPAYAAIDYGNVNVQVPGVSVGTAGSHASVNVSAGGMGGGGSAVQVAVPGAQVNTSGSGAQVNVSAGGAGSVSASVGGGEGTVPSVSLSSVSASALSGANAQSVVSLQGNVSSYITSQNDVDAYAALLTKENPAITNVSASADEVKVSYTQPGTIFGFFPVSMKAVATTKANGSVSIALPWYSFLVSKDTASVESAVKTSLSTGGSASFSPVSQVQVIHAVAASIPAGGGSIISVHNGDQNVNIGTNGIKVQNGSQRVNIGY